MSQCVFELAVEAGSPPEVADPETEGDLDAEGAGRTRRAPQIFAVVVDGAAFV